MKKNSFLVKNEVLVDCAIVAAHSSAQGKDFKQKDVFFLFELFNNWSQNGLWDETDKYQNTQFARYLETLVKNGYAKKIKNQSTPNYRLTRSGLIELIYRITNLKVSQPSQFFFTFNFIAGYKERIIKLVKEEGSLFPPIMQIELESLLDQREFLEREQKRVKNIISHLKQRIDDALFTFDTNNKMRQRGASIEEIAKVIQHDCPYELNNQKPLSELVSSIPLDQQIWELGEGAFQRQKVIWKPALHLILEYEKQLKGLD